MAPWRMSKETMKAMTNQVTEDVLALGVAGDLGKIRKNAKVLRRGHLDFGAGLLRLNNNGDG